MKQKVVLTCILLFFIFPLIISFFFISNKNIKTTNKNIYKISSITYTEALRNVLYKYSYNQTELQTTIEWEKLCNKKIQWQGKIKQVQKKDEILVAEIEIFSNEVKSNILEYNMVTVIFDKENENMLIMKNSGDNVIFIGELNTCFIINNAWVRKINDKKLVSKKMICFGIRNAKLIE